VAEWHPTKNGEVLPDQVSYGSAKRIWWKCPKGPDHEWRTRVCSRTSRGDGCPFCRGFRVSVTNSVERLLPDVAREWHPTRNRKLTPSDVVAGSKRRVWWKCRVAPDHIWRASLRSRMENAGGCPYCARIRASSETSLAAEYPQLAKQWHSHRNGSLK